MNCQQHVTPLKGGIELKIRELKSSAKSRLSGQWGLAIGGLLLFFAILIADNLITNWISPSYELYISSVTMQIHINPMINYILSWIILILSIYLITYPAYVGYEWYYLDLYDEKLGSTGAIFNGFKEYGISVPFMFMKVLFILLWSLLFVIPGIMKSYSYSMAVYILRDYPNMGVVHAISESKRIMKGNKRRLFLLHLSFIGWFLIPIFGIFYGFPYIMTANAAFYRDLVEKEDTSMSR